MRVLCPYVVKQQQNQCMMYEMVHSKNYVTFAIPFILSLCGFVFPNGTNFSVGWIYGSLILTGFSHQRDELLWFLR